MKEELQRLHGSYFQTEDFGRALAKLMEADVAIPDFTSLTNRADSWESRTTFVKRKVRSTGWSDSTCLKVYGEGEWKARPAARRFGHTPWQ